ncbi:unnamed protein product [Adineta ricciae]|uniref:Intraflagellar transport protein 46 homolog n=1 Tax=Adineta ricciae TaxID=249248 RepID=A0A814B7K1_ADIRI|nr:unnamed protein product [Adineta ricciae]
MSDEEDEPRMVHDQPYDESMDIVDGEDVASVYTPQASSRRPAAPDSNYASGGSKFLRERPMHHRPDESPYASPRNDDHDETQGDSDSDQGSSQALHDAGNGQKEYKAPDPNAYDPKMYRDLPVSAEIKDLFKYIDKYQPQDIILETKLKPFVPEYVPAIGDIDAFLKVPRPDGKEDSLGLIVLDEPSSRQSDPHVLGLQMLYTSNQPIAKALPTNVRHVVHADKNPKAIEEWIHNISKLQKSKTGDTVQYRRPMPDVDSLMQEWPSEFEDLLRETAVPPADADVDLPTYIDIACALLDIPVYESRVQSLHALFTLYLDFKNSEHFKAMMNVSDSPMRRGGNDDSADRMNLFLSITFHLLLSRLYGIDRMKTREVIQ